MQRLSRWLTIYILFTCFISMAKAEAIKYTYYSINVAPAAIETDDGVIGYYADILTRLSEELGHNPVNIQTGPYPRIARLFNNNDANEVIITCLFPNSGFKDNVYQPTVVGTFDTAVVSLKGQALTWDNIAGKRIATVRGASKMYGAKFHDRVLDETVTLVSVKDYSQAMKMLKIGRIDGFTGNLHPALTSANNEGISLAEPLLITEKQTMITISVGSKVANGDKIVSEIAAIIDHMRESGEIEAIIDQYSPALD